MVNNGAKEFLDSKMDKRDPGEIMESGNGDYVGEDGLIYCGKCKTKKQTRVNLPESIYGPGKVGLFATMCKCRREEYERQKEEDEFRQKMYQIQRMKDAAMMDSAFRDASFDSYKITNDNKELHDIAKNYAEKFESMYAENQGMLIYGPVGTGKSYTSACIANRLIENHVSVIMTSFVKIMQNIMTRDEAEYLQMLNSARLLILDDLGAERSTDFALEKVCNIIDSRSRARKPMILTTNLELPEMLNTGDIRYQRIYDRIFETCYPIRLGGDSFRKSSAAARFDRMRNFMNE